MNIICIVNQKGGVAKTTSTANLGACLAQQGRVQEAWDVFTHALQLHPDDCPLRLNIGQAYLDYGDFEAARDQFDHILKGQSDHVFALCGIGDVAMARDQIEEALPYFERAVRLDPKCEKARRGYANALFESGDVDRAAACLRDGIDAERDSPES